MQIAFFRNRSKTGNPILYIFGYNEIKAIDQLLQMLIIIHTGCPILHFRLGIILSVHGQNRTAEKFLYFRNIR